jgi:hypothetical protein
MTTLETEDYKAYYDANTSKVVLEGFLRLNGIEKYQPIMNLLLEAATQSGVCVVDLHKLEFLNSSGISMLSMFVVKVRDIAESQLSFIGSQNILWQTRSLKNLKRLMPTLEIQLL